jgi:hypothetical protein
MRRYAVVVAVVVSCWCLPASAAAKDHPAPTPGAPGIGDPYFPLDGNGGYDARHYLLDLRYDPATDVLAGTAVIRARATQNLSSFNLDLVGMTVRAIAVDGRPASWTRDEHELTVTPRKPLRRGHRFTVAVTYDGVPTLDEDPSLGASGWFASDDGATVAGQPHGGAHWFPVNEHPLDKARFTFVVTVPKGTEVVANGLPAGRRTHGGWTTWTWKARDPMASYLATVDIGKWQIDDRTEDGLRYIDAFDPRLWDRPEPHSGSRMAISQAANTTYKRLVRTVEVPDAGGRFTFWVHRDTEQGWDFFFVEAHTPGADDWTTLPDANGHTADDVGFVCPLSLELHPFLAHYETDNGDGTCAPSGTTGSWNAVSGESDGWEQWAIDLSPYAGGSVELSLSYASDDLVNLSGVELDDIATPTGSGSTSFEDDGDPFDGWTVAGAPEGSAPNENDWVTGTAADTPPSAGERTAAAFEREPEIVTFLSDVFGPYPFETVGGIVDATPGIGFALETQTRPVYSRDFFGDETGPPNTSVIVHELAHQWTGDSLALARWRDIWLNEGFATYAEWLWSEHEGQGTPQEIFDSVAQIPADDPFWQLAIGDPGPERLFDNAVYQRGAMTLEALRLRIGDATFFELVRRWVSEHAGGNVTTSQFIALAERLSGQDLGAFFDEWLYTPSRPASLPAPAALARRAIAPASSVRLREGAPRR